MGDYSGEPHCLILMPRVRLSTGRVQLVKRARANSAALFFFARSFFACPFYSHAFFFARLFFRMLFFFALTLLYP